MTNVVWPNEASPGLSTFALEVPEGWTAAETPGVLLTLLAPETDGFRANVLVFGERLPSETTVDRVADLAVDDGTGAAVGTATDRPASAEHLPIAVRRSTEVVDGFEINHLVVSTEAGDHSPAGLRSVYTLIGSFLAARLEQDEPGIKNTIASFTVPVPAD